MADADEWHSVVILRQLSHGTDRGGLRTAVPCPLAWLGPQLHPVSHAENEFWSGSNRAGVRPVNATRTGPL